SIPAGFRYYMYYEVNILGSGSLRGDYQEISGGSLDLFVMTQEQYDYYRTGANFGSLWSLGSSRGGTIDVSLPGTGRYFLVADPGAQAGPHRPGPPGAARDGAPRGSRNHRHDRDVSVEHAPQDPRIPPEPGDLHAARLDLSRHVFGAHVRRHDPKFREHDGTADEDEQEHEDMHEHLPVLQAPQVDPVRGRIEQGEEPVLHPV